MSAKTYKALGLMSGSSLDGLDIAFCEFHLENEKISDWKILQAETLPFSEMWQSRLAHLPTQNALTYAQTHAYFGHYMGQLVNEFITKYKIEPDFIASHGHTIFHFPNIKYNRAPVIKWQEFKIAPGPSNLPEKGIFLGNNIYFFPLFKRILRNCSSFLFSE